MNFKDTKQINRKCNFCDNQADVIDDDDVPLYFRCEMVEPWKKEEDAREFGGAFLND